MIDVVFKLLLLVMMLGMSVIYLGLNSWALQNPDEHHVCVLVVMIVTFVMPLIIWMYMIGAI